MIDQAFGHALSKNFRNMLKGVTKERTDATEGKGYGSLSLGLPF